MNPRCRALSILMGAEKVNRLREHYAPMGPGLTNWNNMNKESYPWNTDLYGKLWKPFPSLSAWRGVLLGVEIEGVLLKETLCSQGPKSNSMNTNQVKCTFFTAGRPSRWGNIMLPGDQVGPSWRYLALQFRESWNKGRNQITERPIKHGMKFMGYIMMDSQLSLLLNFLFGIAVE